MKCKDSRSLSSFNRRCLIRHDSGSDLDLDSAECHQQYAVHRLPDTAHEVAYYWSSCSLRFANNATNMPTPSELS